MNDLREQNENKSLVPANEKWIVLILSIGSNFVNHLRSWWMSDMISPSHKA